MKIDFTDRSPLTFEKAMLIIHILSGFYDCTSPQIKTFMKPHKDFLKWCKYNLDKHINDKAMLLDESEKLLDKHTIDAYKKLLANCPMLISENRNRKINQILE